MTSVYNHKKKVVVNCTNNSGGDKLAAISIHIKNVTFLYCVKNSNDNFFQVSPINNNVGHWQTKNAMMRQDQIQEI